MSFFILDIEADRMDVCRDMSFPTHHASGEDEPAQRDSQVHSNFDSILCKPVSSKST